MGDVETADKWDKNGVSQRVLEDQCGLVPWGRPKKRKWSAFLRLLRSRYSTLPIRYNGVSSKYQYKL